MKAIVANIRANYKLGPYCPQITAMFANGEFSYKDYALFD
jgi:hypothetical protein